MLDASHVVGYNETRTRRSREDEGERIMASFAIEPAFWELFPQAEIGIVVLGASTTRTSRART